MAFQAKLLSHYVFQSTFIVKTFYKLVYNHVCGLYFFYVIMEL